MYGIPGGRVLIVCSVLRNIASYMYMYIRYSILYINYICMYKHFRECVNTFFWRR